jgi:CRISPR/Cas system CSM-associated protein Csm3 (group 7 of RAMP superfamily)
VKSARIIVDISSFWHAGTGRADGASLDAVVERDPDGLPYLPGRTLKGLFRHASRQLARLEVGSVDAARVDTLFGQGANETNVDGDEVPSDSDRGVATRYETTPGKLRFSSARLSSAWRAHVRTREGRAVIPHLFRVVRSTKLENGVADDHTLRSEEVAIPFRLEAEVEAISGELTDEDLEHLRLAGSAIRRVGKHKTRGLGRASITVEASA